MKKGHAVLIIGFVIVVLSVILLIVSEQSTTSSAIRYYPDDHGGVFPYQYTIQEKNHLYLIPVGLLLLVVGVITIFAGIFLSLLKKGSRAKSIGTNSTNRPINESEPSKLNTETYNESKFPDKHCRFCGQSIPVDSAFCEKCGNRLN